MDVGDPPIFVNKLQRPLDLTKSDIGGILMKNHWFKTKRMPKGENADPVLTYY